MKQGDRDRNRDSYGKVPGRLTYPQNRTKLEDPRDHNYRSDPGYSRGNASIDWDPDYNGRGSDRPYLDRYDPYDYKNESDLGSGGGDGYNVPQREGRYGRDDRPRARGAMGRDLEYGKDEDAERPYGRDDRRARNGYEDEDRYPKDRDYRDERRGPRDGDYERGPSSYETGDRDYPRDQDRRREPRDDYDREEKYRRDDRNGDDYGYGPAGYEDEFDSCPVETQETKSSNDDFPTTTDSAILSTPM